jgi:DNA-binding transcriptional MerR regulator
VSEYTIDELAKLAGTNVRNVRAYQGRRLVHPPRRRGRAGVYDDAHLARVRLIGRLLERGYSLANIAEMLTAVEEGRDVRDLPGLERALTSPWSHEAPVTFSMADLAAQFAGAALSPEVLEEAQRLGVLRPSGDGFRVASPRLLDVAAELARSGIPLAVVLRHLVSLREDTERIARRFVQLIDDHVFGVFGKDRLPPASELPRLSEIVERLRPVALTVVELELARALEERIGAVIDERIARIAARK